MLKSDWIWSKRFSKICLSPLFKELEHLKNVLKCTKNPLLKYLVLNGKCLWPSGLAQRFFSKFCEMKFQMSFNQLNRHTDGPHNGGIEGSKNESHSNLLKTFGWSNFWNLITTFLEPLWWPFWVTFLEIDNGFLVKLRWWVDWESYKNEEQGWKDRWLCYCFQQRRDWKPRIRSMRQELSIKGQEIN